jgi:hypothetical protein
VGAASATNNFVWRIQAVSSTPQATRTLKLAAEAIHI